MQIPSEKTWRPFEMGNEKPVSLCVGALSSLSLSPAEKSIAYYAILMSANVT